MKRSLLATLATVAALAAIGAANAGAATPSKAAASAGTLYVQQAQGGTLIKSGGSWKLVLQGADVRTTSFTDRPYRQGGSLPLARFVSGWNREFGRVAPNAALEIADAPPSRDVALVELSSPHYDRSRDTLTFIAKPLQTSSDKALGSLVRRADRGVHGSFGRASLYIDDGDEGNVLEFSFSGVGNEGFIEVAPLAGAAFRFDPAAALFAATPGLNWGTEPKLLQIACYTTTCSGSARLTVEASATAPLHIFVVMPPGGTATASWAGGAPKEIGNPGGELVLAPASP